VTSGARRQPARAVSVPAHQTRPARSRRLLPGQRPPRGRNRDGWPAGQLDRGPLRKRLATERGAGS
jgi:hypothetical protein